MNSEFKSGETIIASISGNFLDSISKNNIYFYRGHVRTSFDYDLAKIGGSYYFYVQTEDKSPNDYSVAIEGVRYIEGSKVYSDDITKDFTVLSEVADFSIEPAFVITDGNFSLHLRNLKGSNVDISITNLQDIELNPWQTKRVEIISEDITETTIRVLDISSTNLAYEFMAYIIKSSKTKEPGESSEEPEETQGSECITNWNCVGDQTCENGFCIGGEEIPEQEQNESEEPQNESAKGSECMINWNCKSNETCENGFCIGGEIYSEELECTPKEGCRKNETCVENICVLKEEIIIEEEIIEEVESEGYEIVADNDGNAIVIIDGEVIKEPATLKTCAEIYGSVCSSSQICDGDSVYAKDNYCCIGSCAKEEPSKNTKIIGWVLIGAIGLLLLAFLSKYRKSKKRKINFEKIARGRK